MRISKRIVALTLILALIFGSVPTTLAADELPAADTPVSSDAPADQPETPADQPETPADQPETPADQPETPADLPEAPAEQPETPADQPEAPADQPEAPADQPETDPAPVEPETPADAAAPAPVEPASVDPTPVDPTPVDPTPVNPTPTPVPVGPTPTPAPQATYPKTYKVLYMVQNVEGDGYIECTAQEAVEYSAIGSNNPQLKDKFTVQSASADAELKDMLGDDYHGSASIYNQRLIGFGPVNFTLDEDGETLRLYYDRFSYGVYEFVFDNAAVQTQISANIKNMTSGSWFGYASWGNNTYDITHPKDFFDLVKSYNSSNYTTAYQNYLVKEQKFIRFGQPFETHEGQDLGLQPYEDVVETPSLFMAIPQSNIVYLTPAEATKYRDLIQNNAWEKRKLPPGFFFIFYEKKAPIEYQVQYVLSDGGLAPAAAFASGTVPNDTYTTLGGKALDAWLQLEYPNNSGLSADEWKAERWGAFFNRTGDGALSDEIKNPNLADGYTLTGISNIDDKAQTITLQIDREVKVTVEYRMENVNDDGYTLYNAEGSDDYTTEVFDLTALAPLTDEKLVELNAKDPANLVTRATMPRELVLPSSVVKELTNTINNPSDIKLGNDLQELERAKVAPIRLPGFAFDHAEQTTDEATGNVTFTLTYKRLRFPYYLRYYPSASVQQTQLAADKEALGNFREEHVKDIFKTGSTFKVDINAWSLERYLPAGFDTDGYQLMYKEYKFGEKLDGITSIDDINAMLQAVNSPHPLLETYDSAPADWHFRFFTNAKDDGYTSNKEGEELKDLMESGQLPTNRMPCGLFMRCYYKKDPLNYTVQYVVTDENGEEKIVPQNELTLPAVLQEQLEAQGSLTYTTLGGKTLGRWMEKNLYPNAPDNTARWQMFFDRTEIGGLASTQPGDEARAALRDVTYQDAQGFTYAVTGIVSIDDTQKTITLRMEKTFGNLQINVNWHHLQGSPTVFFKVTGATDTFSMVVPVSVPSGAASGEQSNTGSSIIYYLPCGSYTVEPVGDWYWNYTLTGTGQNTVAVTNQTTQTISFDAPYRQTPWYNWETYSKSEKVISALG